MTRLAKLIAIVGATLLGLMALWELRGPALVFLLSLVVAAAARTPVDYLTDHRVPRSLAVAGIYLVGLLVLGGVVVAAIYLVSGELGQATKDFTRLYHYAATHLSKVSWIERTVGERSPFSEELLTSLVGRHGEQALGIVLGTAFGVLSTAVDVVFVIVLSVYWTLDRAYFERLWLSLLPLPRRVSARNLWQTLETELGAYARSEITQSLLAGLVLGAGYYLLGLDYPALLALVAALGWLLPWLGVIVALLALAVAELPALVLDGPRSMLCVAAAALLTIAVFAVLEMVVEPRLFKRRRYNSLFIVVAVIALSESLGILGLLLGPMAAVVVQAAVEHIERERVADRSAIHLASLAERVAELQATAGDVDGLTREWGSIIDRLTALIALSREQFEESADTP